MLCEILASEVSSHHGKSRPSIEESSQLLLSWLEDGSWNSCELCRIINGHQPGEFKGCFWTVEEKGWFDHKGNCRAEQRGCRILRQTLLSRLKALQKKGLVSSMKINWLDGRERGAAQYIPTDYFRFWFIHREHLSQRLIQDVLVHIGDPGAIL